MQRPTVRSWDRQLNLVGVAQIARTRSRAEAPHTSTPFGLPSVKEIVDAILGSVAATAARERHTLTFWASELARVYSQPPNDFAVDGRMRAARIIRIIDICIQTYVLQDDDAGSVRGETVGSLIDRIAEVGAALDRIRNLRTTPEISTDSLERKLDRLAKQYTTVATALVAGQE